MLAGEADQITEEAGVMPLSDRLSSMVSLVLGKIIRNYAAGSLDDATGREEFMRLLKELARLRRDDREAARMRNFLLMNPPYISPRSPHFDPARS
jgi:hypothetical protein